LHNKPIGCSASGAYASGPDDEEDDDDAQGRKISALRAPSQAET